MPAGLAGLLAHLAPIAVAGAIALWVAARPARRTCREASLPRLTPANEATVIDRLLESLDGEDDPAWTPSDAVCEQMLRYDAWREAEDLVALAWESYAHLGDSVTFGAYMAALDCEQYAARDYQRAVAA